MIGEILRQSSLTGNSIIKYQNQYAESRDEQSSAKEMSSVDIGEAVATFDWLLEQVSAKEKLIMEKQMSIDKWQETLDKLTLAKEAKYASDLVLCNQTIREAKLLRDSGKFGEERQKLQRALDVADSVSEIKRLRAQLRVPTKEMMEAEVMYKCVQKEHRKHLEMTKQAKKKLYALKDELMYIYIDLSKLEKALKKKKSRHRHGFLCQFFINSSSVELASLNNDLSKLEKKVERAISPALRARIEEFGLDDEMEESGWLQRLNCGFSCGEDDVDSYSCTDEKETGTRRDIEIESTMSSMTGSKYIIPSFESRES
jgi:hypothetical protein